ncbi:MAG: glycosyltransferase family 39 protein [Anaerolineae bacterium]|nr:glycosyltransferase family 39 protein [Anaerolineae bacterium]
MVPSRSETDLDQAPGKLQADTKTIRSLWIWVGIVMSYTGLTALLTYPLAWNLNSAIIGGPGDNFQFIWDFWWVKKAVLELHTNPYVTDMLYYPMGYNLGRHTHVMALSLLSIPFQLVMPVETVYNLFVLSGIIANALAAYHLARYVTGFRSAAFLAGAMFAFSPVFVVRITGHLNNLHAWVLPLALLFLMRWFDENRLRYAVLAAIVLAMSAMINEYFAVFIVFMWLVLVVAYWRDKHRTLRRLVVQTGLCLLLAGLFLIPDLYLRRAAFTEPGGLEGWSRPLSADLLGFITPGWFHTFFGDAVLHLTGGKGGWLDPVGTKYEAVVYLGITALLLAGYAVFSVERSKTRPWLYLGLFFAIMSLGPVLHVAGQFEWDPAKLGLARLATIVEPVYEFLGVQNRNIGVPLPYLLYQKIPYLNAARAANRWAVVTVLSVAILAALAVTRLRTSSSFQRRPWLYGGAYIAIFLLVIFESLAVPFPLTSTALPRTYATIMADPSEFAILELPIDLTSGADDIYYQTKHSRPLLHGMVSRSSQTSRSLIENDPFLSLLDHPEWIPSACANPPTTVFGQYRIKYIIVNQSELEETAKLYGGDPQQVYDLLTANFVELPSNDLNRRLFQTYAGDGS